MTHPDDTGREWYEILGMPEGEWTELENGAGRYPQARRCGAVRVGYGADPRMGSHAIVPGSGCRDLESRWGVERDDTSLVADSSEVGADGGDTWQSFIAGARVVGVRFRRLDLYIDVRDGAFTVAECRRKWMAGHARARTHQAGGHERLELGAGKNRGETLSIGSRESDTYVRIYDKAQEQCPKHLSGQERQKWLDECGPWVRVEIELKRERAEAAAKLIAERGFGWGLIASLINSHVEFKEADARGHNGNRVPTWGVWAKVMGATEKITLVGKREAMSVGRVIYNVQRQWGPSLWVVLAAHEGKLEQLMPKLLGSAERVKEKHRAVLAEWDRCRETWEAA